MLVNSRAQDGVERGMPIGVVFLSFFFSKTPGD